MNPPAHLLDPLLRPRSIALVGASARENSAGHALILMSRIDGYEGAVAPINPRYQEIEGLKCYPSLSALPEAPEHAVLSVANARLEAALEEAITAGVRAVTMFGSGVAEGDVDPPLRARLERRAREAGVAVCGHNCMGFYSPLAGLRVAAFNSAPGLRRGGVAWLAQSGSAFSALAHNERRLGFSLVVSTGAELVTTVADYMDWALAQPETRVIGLFLESVREPAGFMRALEKAAERGIPVAAIKVGRTARSAAMAQTHTGAIAGNDAAYRAIFRRHGVIQVDDLDEMAAVLALADLPRRPAAGGLATMHDSGGQREMMVDLAERHGTPLATITETTKARIRPNLDPGLVADNPLDAWGTDRDYASRYAKCFTALLDDPGVAMGGFFSDVRENYWYSQGVLQATIEAAGRTEKPVFIASNTTLTADVPLMLSAAEAGVPVVKGTREALIAAGALMGRAAWRPKKRQPVTVDAALSRRWRERLAEGRPLDEQDGLAMLADYGIAVPALRQAATREEVAAAVRSLRAPFVLKTAEGHAHKSDVGGVRVGLADQAAALSAYDDMAARLGPSVLVMEMAPQGVEVGLGALIDPDFGPVIIVSAGGILIEILDDTVAGLAPLSVEEAAAMLDELKLARLLAGVRGRPAADREALAETVSRFSVLVADLADHLAEIDVNPVIAGPAGAMAVDCLVVARQHKRKHA